MSINTALKIFIISTFSLCAFVYTAYSASDLAQGKEKYDQLCATCHGIKGAGDGAAAAALDPKPRNLCKTTKSDADLKKTISQGGAAVGLSAAMPPWGGVLSDTEIDNVIAYIKTTLCQ